MREDGQLDIAPENVFADSQAQLDRLAQTGNYEYITLNELSAVRIVN